MKWKITRPQNDIQIKTYQHDAYIIFQEDGRYLVICEGESEDKNIWTGLPHKLFAAAKVVVKSKYIFL